MHNLDSQGKLPIANRRREGIGLLNEDERFCTDDRGRILFLDGNYRQVIFVVNRLIFLRHENILLRA